MAQNKLNVRRGDKVVVITGKDAGKQGTVRACSPKTSKIIVEGVNIVSRHSKPRSAQDKGGIIKKEAAIDVSNVMIVCPTCGKPTRISHKVVEGKSVRVCKCGSVIARTNDAASKKKEKKALKETKPVTEEKKNAPTQKVDKSTNEKVKKSAKNRSESVIVKRKQEM